MEMYANLVSATTHKANYPSTIRDEGLYIPPFMTVCQQLLICAELTFLEQKTAGH